MRLYKATILILNKYKVFVHWTKLSNVELGIVSKITATCNNTTTIVLRAST